ncbi:MAG: helical backbone metal receptor [Planctomycetota bacterium]
MRVVSLVPSLTETLFALGLTADEVVGRTPWCIHPAPLVERVAVVGGTKTPNLKKIARLQPDLVVLDREENPRATYDALREAGIAVWVAEVRRVADVPGMLESLGAAIDRPQPARELADALRDELAHCPRDRSGDGPVALPLIWHEPLMALSPTRYGGDLVRTAGYRVPDLDPPDGNGYPTVTPRAIGAAGVELLLLTSEPHDFTPAEGEAIADAVAAEGFARPVPLKVDGEALTWFGARTADGLRWFRALASNR